MLLHNAYVVKCLLHTELLSWFESLHRRDENEVYGMIMWRGKKAIKETHKTLRKRRKKKEEDIKNWPEIDPELHLKNLQDTF